MILYTRTVCPKCMLVKTMLDGADVDYETVNLDFDLKAEEELKEKGFMGLPIALDAGEYYADIPAIQALIAEKSK
ncbi:glutaredoxin family protein [Lysinibacillus xylanilyticus]|uniref:glutaredoxin family protein n=1 Tax=Lysinibacillus xylanilyticus TaxID=582475 RepID=UPI0037FAFA0E